MNEEVKSEQIVQIQFAYTITCYYQSLGFFILILRLEDLQHDWPKEHIQHFSKTFQYHLITIIHHLYHIYAQYD